jgi:hypothetical protein
VKPSFTYDKHTNLGSAAYYCYAVMLDTVCCVRQAVFWKLDVLPSSGKSSIMKPTLFGMLD